MAGSGSRGVSGWWTGDPLRPEDPARIGAFRVLARLGQGGMGRVYLARSRSGLLVAIKTIRADLADDEGFRERFAREVAAARRVSGVYTAAVVDADADAEAPWLATAYVPAPPLDVLVRAHGPLPPGAVRWIGAGIAEALESIHAAGVVHRDLKPSNVMITHENPKVIDFGIARAAGGATLTRSLVIGTPQFMAPEQALDTGSVTSAADVYSLGATLLHAATGHEPYSGTTPVNVLARLLSEPPDLEGLPDELAPMITACLSRDPRERPTTGELLEEFSRYRNAVMPHAAGAEDWLPVAAMSVVRDYERAGRGVPPGMPGARTAPAGLPPTEAAPAGAADPTVVVGPGGDPFAAPSADAETTAVPPRPGPPRPSRRKLLAGGAGMLVVAAAATATKLLLPADGDGDRAEGAGGGSSTPPPPVTPWRFATLDQVYSSPVVADNTVYIGSNDRNLYLLDARTGGVRGTFSAPSGISSTPLPLDGTVYVGCDDGVLRAIDASTQELRWEFPTGGTIHSSPAHAEGRIYVGSRDKNLYAVDAATGREVWRFPAGDWFNSSPAVADGVVYIACRDKTFYAVDAATGARRWGVPAGSTADSSPAVENGRVFVGSDDRFVYALNAEDGATVWRLETGGGVVSSPLIADGALYVGSDDGHLYSADTATGRVRWKYRTGNQVRSSPAIADGLVYVGSRDRFLHAVDAVGGTLRWKFETKGPIDDSSPAVAEGLVFVGSLDHSVYAVDAREGVGPALI